MALFCFLQISPFNLDPFSALFSSYFFLYLRLQKIHGTFLMDNALETDKFLSHSDSILPQIYMATYAFIGLLLCRII